MMRQVAQQGKTHDYEQVKGLRPADRGRRRQVFLIAGRRSSRGNERLLPVRIGGMPNRLTFRTYSFSSAKPSSQTVPNTGHGPAEQPCRLSATRTAFVVFAVANSTV